MRPFGLLLLGMLASVYVHANPALMAPEATRLWLAQHGEENPWQQHQFDALRVALARLDEHGLSPDEYHLRELSEAPTAALATDAWLTAAAHLVYGKLDPVSMEPDWSVARREADLAGLLTRALADGDLAGALNSLAPSHLEYRSLQHALAMARGEMSVSETLISPGGVLKSGMSGPRVAQLRRRLEELGLLPAESVEADVFEQQTKLAVEEFQHREQLDADGVVGSATLRALNRSYSARIAQLRVNLERWRWLPDKLGDRHLRANIAAFEVTAYSGGVPIRTYPTIVGKAYRQTPVFTADMRYIIFNPWWETPDKLARLDKLPLFQRDPQAATRLGFQVINREGQVLDNESIDWSQYSARNFPFRLRQAPGDQNALGRVKMMFPNVHSVYLHDTPTKDLFSRRQRAFSSGCLRTHEPLELAAWLLEGSPGWDREAIDRAVSSAQETRANLKVPVPVPVHVLYLTVVEDAGSVRYLDDIYDRDARVLSALDQAPGAAKP